MEIISKDDQKFFESSSLDFAAMTFAQLEEFKLRCKQLVNGINDVKRVAHEEYVKRIDVINLAQRLGVDAATLEPAEIEAILIVARIKADRERDGSGDVVITPPTAVIELRGHEVSG